MKVSQLPQSKLSVVAIPAHNEASYITDCLAALALQRDEAGAPIARVAWKFWFLPITAPTKRLPSPDGRRNRSRIRSRLLKRTCRRDNSMPAGRGSAPWIWLP